MTVSLSWPTAAAPGSPAPTGDALPAPFRARRRELQTPGGRCRLHHVPASGRPLLLVHGVTPGASSFDLRPLVEAYSGRRPVYALDLPGFGQSDRAAGSYDAARHDAAVDAALDVVATEHRGVRADLVALSAGSEYIAHAALRHPERVRSLVMLSPTGLAAAPPAAPWASLARSVRAVPGLGPLVSSQLHSPQAIRRHLAQRFAGSVDRSLLAYAVRSARVPGAHHAALDALAGLAHHDDALELYRALPLPTLVLHDQDPTTDFARLPELRQLNPVVRSVRIAGTRGFCHFERLAETLVQLQTFFASLEPTAAAGAARPAPLPV